MIYNAGRLMLPNQNVWERTMDDLTTQRNAAPPGKPVFQVINSVPPPRELSKQWWMRAQDDLLDLCRELEDIADSLPASINRQTCIHAARAVGPLIKIVHSYEEKVLFPALSAGSAGSEDFAQTLQRLKFEHFADECFAEELSERLLLLGAGDADVNMEATGYMLRGFFEGLRRHLAFEREHLLTRLDDDGSPSI